jgi:hypothetical protein
MPETEKKSAQQDNSKQGAPTHGLRLSHHGWNEEDCETPTWSSSELANWYRLLGAPSSELGASRLWLLHTGRIAPLTSEAHPTTALDVLLQRYERRQEDLADRLTKRLAAYQESNVLAMEAIAHRTADVLRGSVRELDRGHVDILEKASAIESQIQTLAAENHELRELLDGRFSAKSLVVVSVGATVALMASLVAYFALGVVVVHPGLAAIGLAGSCGFGLLAAWRLSGGKHSK